MAFPIEREEGLCFSSFILSFDEKKDSSTILSFIFEEDSIPEKRTILSAEVAKAGFELPTSKSTDDQVEVSLIRQPKHSSTWSNAVLKRKQNEVNILLFRSEMNHLLWH